LRSLTLNQRLIFAVSIALTPVAALSVIQGVSSYQYGQRLIRERLISSALATAAVQREPVARSQQMLESMARNPDVLAMTSRCSGVMRAAMRDQSQIVNYIRSDAAGIPRCSGIAVTEPTSFADQQWWRDAVKAHGFSLSRPTIGQVSRRRVLLALLPLFDNRTGAFQGMVSAGVQLSWVETALQRTTLSSDAVAAIAGSDGTILIAAKPSSLKKIDVKSSFGTSTLSTDDTGKKWLYSSAPIYDRQLFVVYAEPQSALVGFTRSQLRADIALPILAVLLASIAVWMGVNQAVTRWLRELGSLARQFANGDYAGSRERFQSAPSEIIALSADLHDMAAGIEKRNADLEAAAATTVAMAREVNHRVKNNLQLIISLLGLQAGQIKDEAALLTLSQTRIRIGALGVIYRLMYDEDGGAEGGKVNLQRLFTDLCTQLRMDAIGRTGVDLECSAPDITLSVDTVIPLALFTVEAVTNAFRHGFPDGERGVIVATLSIDTAWRLAVEDNGRGFDTGVPTATIGVELMNAFARQLGGDLLIDTYPGQGVKIALTFPEATLSA
jgi:two-component sensor histidine kinase